MPQYPNLLVKAIIEKTKTLHLNYQQTQAATKKQQEEEQIKLKLLEEEILAQQQEIYQKLQSKGQDAQHDIEMAESNVAVNSTVTSVTSSDINLNSFAIIPYNSSVAINSLSMFATADIKPMVSEDESESLKKKEDFLKKTESNYSPNF